MNPDSGRIVAWPDAAEEQEKLRDEGFVPLPARLQSHAAALLAPATTRALKAKRKRERQNRKHGRRHRA